MSLEIKKDKENLIYRLDRITDLIKGCDTKASIVIAGIGIFFTIFSSSDSIGSIKKLLENTVTDIDFANILYLVLLGASILTIFYGLFCLIYVLVPRLKKFVANINVPANTSLYFFSEISSVDYSVFKQKMYADINTKRELEDLLSQIYINAHICEVKYKFYRKGIIWSFSGIAAFIIFYSIGLILCNLGGV